MELRTYLPDGWQFQVKSEGPSILAPNRVAAEEWLETAAKSLARSAYNIGGTIEISWPRCSRPYRFTPRLSTVDEQENHQPVAHTPLSQTNLSINPLTLLPDANYQKISEFLVEKWQEGKSVCVVSMIDDKCLFQNDRLTPSRAILRPHEWIGQNYRWYWRDSMGDYDLLIDKLKRDRNLPKFHYRLRRADGSFAAYETDYYYVDDFLGVPCRVGISDLTAWQLIEPVNLTN